jgi:glutamate--cysteine ligase
MVAGTCSEAGRGGVTMGDRVAPAPVDGRPTGRPAPDDGEVLRTREQALEHVHAICFKTGPPRRVGVELEWIVHHAEDPARRIDRPTLAAALGEHAPRTLSPDSPEQPLPSGGTVTVEPGGQVEIATPPHSSLAQLHADASADLGHLTARLASHGLRLGEHAIDPYRSPSRLLHTRRYDAMATVFSRHGGAGLTMMCGTAATQVCVDAGEPDRLPGRWRALHALGPVLVALFANSRRHAGRDTGWASARMRTWLDTDPSRTAPVKAGASAGEPALAWAHYALDAPLLCLRRPDGGWDPPAGVTFADWIDGRLRPAPTIDDLEYHLGTLFPPVRPRGYVEARFLDAQSPRDWFAPVAVLAAVLGSDETTAQVRDVAAPVAGAWTTAARSGLADRAVRAAAARVVDLACRALTDTDLSATTRDAVTETVSRRLAGRKEDPR